MPTSPHVPGHILTHKMPAIFAPRATPPESTPGNEAHSPGDTWQTGLMSQLNWLGHAGHPAIVHVHPGPRLAGNAHPMDCRWNGLNRGPQLQHVSCEHDSNFWSGIQVLCPQDCCLYSSHWSLKSWKHWVIFSKEILWKPYPSYLHSPSGAVFTTDSEHNAPA